MNLLITHFYSKRNLGDMAILSTTLDLLDKEFKSKLKNSTDEETREKLRNLLSSTKKEIGEIYEGKVLEVVERKQNLYAGHLEEEAEKFFFVSHDKKIYTFVNSLTISIRSACDFNLYLIVI
jgi:predicted nucleotidyltransferase